MAGNGEARDYERIEGVTPGEHRARGEGVAIRWGISATPFGSAAINFQGRWETPAGTGGARCGSGRC